jgi:hypothetical protein
MMNNVKTMNENHKSYFNITHLLVWDLWYGISMKEKVNEINPIRIPKTLKPLKGMLNKDSEVKSLSKIRHGLKYWS